MLFTVRLANISIKGNNYFMTIEISSSPSIRALDYTNRHFTIVSGMVTAGRASIEISKNCPDKYQRIFFEAVNAGWIKPIAHVTEEEYMVMQLSN